MKKFRKKGSIVDLLPLIVMLFVFFITIFVVALVWYNLNLGEAGFRETDTQKSIMDKSNLFYTQGLDSLFLLFYFGLCMVTIISAALVRINPMMFVPIIIVWILMTGTLGLISKSMYEDFVADDSWSNITNDFGKTKYIMGNIAVISLVVGLLIIISFVVSSRYANE